MHINIMVPKNYTFARWQHKYSVHWRWGGMNIFTITEHFNISASLCINCCQLPLTFNLVYHIFEDGKKMNYAMAVNAYICYCIWYILCGMHRHIILSYDNATWPLDMHFMTIKHTRWLKFIPIIASAKNIRF